MKREITIVKEGNVKKMNLSVLIVLTESEAEKLNCEGLIQSIDNLAKDFHINWAVRKSANNEIIDISRTCQNGIIDDAFIHQLEMDATNFMSELEKMELEKKCLSHEAEETNVPPGFIEELLRRLNLDEDDPDRIRGAELMCVGFPFFCGSVSPEALKEMCELYLKAHEQD